jgi:hypothetical protein
VGPVAWRDGREAMRARVWTPEPSGRTRTRATVVWTCATPSGCRPEFAPSAGRIWAVLSAAAATTSLKSSCSAPGADSGSSCAHRATRGRRTALRSAGSRASPRSTARSSGATGRHPPGGATTRNAPGPTGCVAARRRRRAWTTRVQENLTARLFARRRTHRPRRSPACLRATAGAKLMKRPSQSPSRASGLRSTVKPQSPPDSARPSTAPSAGDWAGTSSSEAADAHRIARPTAPLSDALLTQPKGLHSRRAGDAAEGGGR